MPKGVTLAHDQLLRSAYATCRTRRMELGRRLFIPIPLFHAFGYVEGLLAMILVRGCVILSEQRFSPRHALELMRRFGANDIICVPPVMIDLIENGKPEASDFPALHAAYWAGTCPDWLWEAGEKAFGIRDLTTGYGMTECGSTTFMVPAGSAAGTCARCHGWLKSAGSAGLPGRDALLEVRLCEPDAPQQIAADGTPGELQCRGLSVTAGYYREPEINRRAFLPGGWFRTGDLCKRNPDGSYSFQGRIDDQFKVNGENVSPGYVDHVLSRCALVRQVQTVGVRHEKMGAACAAFIEPSGETDAAAQTQLYAYCRAHLIRYQIPQYIIWGHHEAWPLTATGKISKTRLRELAQTIISSAGEDGRYTPDGFVCFHLPDAAGASQT